MRIKSSYCMNTHFGTLAFIEETFTAFYQRSESASFAFRDQDSQKVGNRRPLEATIARTASSICFLILLPVECACWEIVQELRNIMENSFLFCPHMIQHLPDYRISVGPFPPSPFASYLPPFIEQMGGGGYRTFERSWFSW